MSDIDKLIEQTKFKEALELINEHLLLNDSDANLLMKKANVLYFSNDFENALLAVDKAILNGKSSAWAYARKGLILNKLSRFQESIVFLKKAIDANLVHFEICFGMAIALKNLGEIDNSKEYFKKALSLNSNLIFMDWGITSEPVRKILQTRLKKWLKEKDPKYMDIVRLLNKQNCKEYTQNKGIHSPKTYLSTSNFDGLRLSQFPSRVVIKPEDGADSNGVHIIENGIDLFTLKKIPDDLSEFIEKEVALYSFTKDKKVIIEELINDVDYKNDPYLKIPRDFKVFAAGGQVFYIGVYNRNAKKKLRSVVEYSPQWKRIDRMSTAYLPGVTEFKPDYFDEMISLAKEISSEFPYVMRLDFYLSDNGPIFGEFTPNPSAGLNFTKIGERTLQQLFFVYSDEYSI